VTAPALFWEGRAAERRWLVLEDVPQPLPRDRWGADPEVLGVLARLHESEALPGLRARDAYRPAWTARTTASALAALPADEAAGLGPVIEALRDASVHLFAPWCSLSGDANPGNWGLRADGTLVLFDWERYCRGTPALDLAAALPGLGTPEEHHLLARRYLEAGGTASEPRDGGEALARDIGRAKAWTAVELLAGVGEEVVEDGSVAAWLRGEFPAWVRTLARATGDL
jgi:aminoglycoside phosphotransferase (APT) family kinase protein